jgi:hypothetical protein
MARKFASGAGANSLIYWLSEVCKKVGVALIVAQ